MITIEIMEKWDVWLIKKFQAKYIYTQLNCDNIY